MAECQLCDKDGYIHELRKVEGYNYPLEFAKVCPCGKNARLKFNSKINRLGLGNNFKNKTFVNFETFTEELKEKKQKCIEYATNYSKMQFEKKNSIYISGNVGAGKTHLATAISNRLLQQGIDVEYFEYRERITKIKQVLTDNKEYNNLTKCKEIKVLFIDDLFKGKISESDINIMYEIINYRYQMNLATIITSEKSLIDVLKIDSAIGSRIAEMCCKTLTIKAENYRLKN